MPEAPTPWLRYLEDLRPHLRGRDHRGRRGSLRWLETLMGERGGRAGTVRNILYKDLGSPEEKERLYGVFADLYREAGLEPPPPPAELFLESARKALGRDKRRIFRRFLKELEAGERPQMAVVGGPATGKGVLLSAIGRALAALPGREPFLLNLGGELAQALVPLAEGLGVAEEVRGLLAQLSPTQPYILQGALQQEVLALLAQALNRAGRPLLLRAEAEGTLEGLPLRGPDGAKRGLATWLEPFLKTLTVPYLAALSEPPPTLPHQPLSPPSREEARRFVRERLPHLPPERLEALVNQAGRNFGELSRLVLLEAAKHDPQTPLQDDPALRPLLLALAAFSPEADPAFPLELLEKALGRPLERLSQAERALLDWVGEGLVRPALRSLLPEETPRALHRLALEFFPKENLFRKLYHARKAWETGVLLELVQEDPTRLALLPGLWEEARAWPREDQEALAAAVVRYRAVLGQYAHPEAEEALKVLSQAQDPALRTWARIKGAEAKADAALYREAEELLPPKADLRHLDETAQAEGLLVMAAVERWKGDYERAARFVEEAESLPVAPFLRDRVQLWRGLVAKDLGRYAEALAALAQVGHDPLLLGRARYQMGDLLMRLGRLEARAHMEEGLKALEEGGAPRDEVARVRARYATLLRRLGLYEEAGRAIRRALEEALDPFTQARVASEAGILEVARGRPFEALALLERAEAYFRRTEERPKEARYRHLRTLFRLGAAYLLLEAGQPYRPPLLGGQEAPTARGLLARLLEELPGENTDRYTALRLDAAGLLALLLPPEEGKALLRPLLELENPYLRAQARLGYAEVLVRGGSYGEALGQVVALPPLEDPGLLAQARAVEVLALLGLGEKEAAWAKLEEARRGPLPPPFRFQLGRALGRFCPELHLRLPPSPLALPEALGFHLANPD
ncbi:tetratricopeptide repeat protein [Thermus thermamylovorans]|uniref:Tetratricopeptide repeat protein n=1 Tax=Thermus thermamylovorans TaxID=2509362 RepID=A0A4V6MRG1_9DEIN|nr:tetratricopeptide repeat protein [Thermus thermamylovorans]TBH20516.1 tetratricopeptide repeat protein [Thermus thermamylovorans]